MGFFCDTGDFVICLCDFAIFVCDFLLFMIFVIFFFDVFVISRKMYKSHLALL